MAPRSARPLLALATLPLLVLAGCSSDGGSTGPDPSISIAVSPGTISIVQGDDGTVTVQLTRSGGFEGPVTITVTGLPASVTVAPTVLAAGETDADLTLSVGGDAPAGDATLTVRADGSGVSQATATLTLEVEEAPGGTFSLAFDPATLEIAQGESGSATILIDRDGGFEGTVDLVVTGAPAGLATTLGSASVEGDETSLDVDVGSEVAAETHTLTVTGTGEGTADVTATLDVTVTETSAGTFELSLSPASLSVEQGASESTTVEIDRSGGFQGAVDLTVSGAPAGLGTTLGSTSVSGTETSLAVAAGGSLAPGDYTLTVTGSGQGTEERTAELEVTVTQAGGGTTEASWSFCTDVPIWFAVKDGMGGAWQRVTADGGGTFDFEVASDVAGVAYVQQDAFAGTELNVLLVGAGELEQLGASFCEQAGTKSVDVTVQPLAADEIASLSLGPASLSIIGAGGNTGTFEQVPDGPLDFFGARSEIDTSTGAQTLNRFFLRRGVDAADGGSVTVDFSGGDSFAPEERTATIDNLGSDMASLSLAFGTTTSTTFAGFATLGTVSTETTRPLPLVPESRQESDDYHTIYLGAIPDPQPERFRHLIRFFSGVEDQELALGPELDDPTVTVASLSPYLRLRVQHMTQAAYDDYAFLTAQQDSRSVTFSVTDGYTGGGDLDVVMPDLSGADGWDGAWVPTIGGGDIDASFGAFGWGGGVSGSLFPDNFTDGLTILGASVLVQITP